MATEVILLKFNYTIAMLHAMVKKLQINIAHVLATQNIKQVLHLTSVALIQIKTYMQVSEKQKKVNGLRKMHINTALLWDILKEKKKLLVINTNHGIYVI